MPNFIYTAKSLDGQVKMGNADAKDIRELAQSLKGEGLILVKADSEVNKQRVNLIYLFCLEKFP